VKNPLVEGVRQLGMSLEPSEPMAAPRRPEPEMVYLHVRVRTIFGFGHTGSMESYESRGVKTGRANSKVTLLA